ncbi:stage II sporulation protein M [Stutzerimonas tarimensis]|uniref:Stage II sporulation protein M n=1 Tax=Stutzerimonas tarimensis TaxID=1507735 RepID=A0ABV7SZT3_9GAMM
MKQQAFEQRHRHTWQAFSIQLEALEQARGQPVDPASFPAAYRRLCQHLSLAQSRGYSQGLVDHLQYLVQRGHLQLYRHRSLLLARIIAFTLGGLPLLVRQEWRFVLVASLLFYGSLLLAGLLVFGVPELARALLSATQIAQMEQMYDPDRARLGRFGERTAAADWMMFGYYIMNNVGIAFQTFAGGLLAGLGTLFFLLFNGLTIGAVAGHLTGIGYHHPFYSFVIGHGAFELTGISLAGAAGLRIGWALIAPGQLRRADALRQASSVGVQLVSGALLLLLIAAFVEAYWSSMTFATPLAKYLVGAALWLLVALYLTLGGRQHDAS